MTIFYKIPVIFFIFITTVNAQWHWQNPLPQGNGFYGVHFSDANTGTAVGGNGTVVRTTNGGDKWTAQSSGTTDPLYGVYFFDANNGIIVGGQFGETGIVLRTSNGGENWTLQNLYNDELRAVSFPDNNTGYIVGGSGKIFKTTDGGTKWINLESG